MPRVSVIVPVYNTENVLERCVGTLVNQTISDIEIILVDDGSPDNAGMLCDNLAKKDGRIKVIHKKNGGLSSARNAGLKIGVRRLYQFYCSDDYVALDMYEKMLGRINKDESDMAICSHFTVSESGVCEKHLSIEKSVLEQEDIEENLILPLIGFSFYRKPAMVEGFVWRHLLSKKLIANNEFLSERAYYAEDVVFDLQIYPNAKRVSVLQECLYYYVFYPESLSNKYRDGLWDMMCGLYEIKKVSASKAKNRENASERLDMAIIRSALGCIKNLKKQGSPYNKRECIDEIKRICNNKELQEACKRSARLKLDIRFGLFSWLLRFKMPTLIYYLM